MKRLGFLVISVLIMISSVVFGVVFNNVWKISGMDNLALYIVAKSLFGLAFLLIVVRGCYEKNASSYIVMYVGGIVVQFIPFFIRVLSLLEHGFVASTVLFFVALVIYAAIVFGLLVVDKKMRKAQKTLEGERYSPQNENEGD